MAAHIPGPPSRPACTGWKRCEDRHPDPPLETDSRLWSPALPVLPGLADSDLLMTEGFRAVK